jgi:hypothetical protein
VHTYRVTLVDLNNNTATVDVEAKNSTEADRIALYETRRDTLDWTDEAHQTVPWDKVDDFITVAMGTKQLRPVEDEADARECLVKAEDAIFAWDFGTVDQYLETYRCLRRKGVEQPVNFAGKLIIHGKYGDVVCHQLDQIAKIMRF